MSELRAAGCQITATLRSPLEVLLGIAAAGGLLVLTVWLPNLGLLWHQTMSSRLPLAGRLHLLWSSLGALGTNFTPLEAVLMVAVAILFGLTVAVTSHGLRRRTTGQAAGSLGVAGAAAGLLRPAARPAGQCCCHRFSARAPAPPSRPPSRSMAWSSPSPICCWPPRCC